MGTYSILASHLLQQKLKWTAKSKVDQGFNDTLNCYTIFDEDQTLGGKSAQWPFCSMLVEMAHSSFIVALKRT